MTLALVVLLSLSAAPAKGKPKDPPPAAANDPVARAKELFQRAQKLYAQARYAEAITQFEEAYLLKPHPVISFNIGKCWEQLGETAKALRAYRDYLRLSPNATDKDTVSDAIANLERRLKEKGVQQLMVFADPANATITVDGKVLGSSPASVELAAGNHTLSVKAEGFEPVERSFVMSTQRATEMTITLRPVVKDAPTVEATTTAPAGEKTATITPAETAAAGQPISLTDQPHPPRRRMFTWVAAGLAVVGAGSGIALGVMSRAASAELLAEKRDTAQADMIVSRASTFALGANIGYGVAAGMAVLAVVLFFLEGR